MVGQESDDKSVAIASNTSSNMRNYLQRATGDMSLQQGCEAVVVNVAPIAQSGKFDYHVPLNLIPHQKDQSTIEHARMTYRYRHILKQDDSTIGLVSYNEVSLAKYRTELEIIFDDIMIAGKHAYESQIVFLSKEMGIKRCNKQDICNFSDLQQWAVHHSNHGHHKQQMDVLDSLTTMFFYKLDAVGCDFWLDRVVSVWTNERKIVLDHDPNYLGNKIFGRKRASDGFVKSLFKWANLDYYISLLQTKLNEKYGVTFCQKKNPKGTIMEYRPVIKGGQQCGWIGRLAKNEQLWDDEDDCEKLKNTEGTASMGTSIFLIEVVQSLKNWCEFELAGKVQRLLGQAKNRMVIGMDIEHDEDKSHTSPLTDESAAQVRIMMWDWKIKQSMTHTEIVARPWHLQELHQWEEIYGQSRELSM
jgi:hypothetical protein